MLDTPQEPRNKTAPGNLVNQVINLYQKGDIPATLSRAQELIQTFRAMDKGDNGTLSKNEIMMGFSSCGKKMTEEEIDQLFEKLD